MSKITLEHLIRKAYIYIRQSSMGQVYKHLESQRLQYQLVELGQKYGWSDPVIIDEDLGRTGSGTICRPGFSHLLTAVAASEVGAIFCLDASRLARNNREWSTLIDYCAVVDTLLIDLDGIYDPRNITDRATLGLKGTMSEYESGIFRQRCQTAILSKAKRGEFYTNLAAGYLLTEDKLCEMDPNQRIQDAFYLVFRKFREFGSATQLVAWFQAEAIEIPCKTRKGEISWKLPTQSIIRKILKNPIYAGAYAYGRSQTRVQIIDNQRRKVNCKDLPIEEWQVLIQNHHPGFISWDEYLANQKRLEQNMNRRGMLVQGAPKRGPALLVGLLRCQRCGRKLRVRYSGTKSVIPRYICPGQENIGQTENCISFYGARIEKLVIEEVLLVVEPVAISAAQEAEELYHQQQSEKEQSITNALAQAEYEANRCFEQFNLADPKNRLVIGNLEQRWNGAMEKVEQTKQQLAQLKKEYQPLSETERQALYRLAEDLSQAWNDPETDVRLKKRILQTLIKEIVVDIDADNYLAVTIHWIGGTHTRHRIKLRKKGERQSHLHPESEQIVCGLAEVAHDQDIARILNLLQIKTATGKTWNAIRVGAFRRKHSIPVFEPVEYEKKGWVNLQQAADMLQTHPETVSRLIKANIIKARQVVKYSPWIIEKEQLQQPTVVNTIAALKQGKYVSLTKAQYQLDI